MPWTKKELFYAASRETAWGKEADGCLNFEEAGAF